MNIVVCLKQVPDTNEVKIDPKNRDTYKRRSSFNNKSR